MGDTLSQRERAIDLIREIRSGDASDERQQRIVAELDQLLPDPNYFDYMVDFVPEMTPEEIVEKAFSYKPIIL